MKTSKGFTLIEILVVIAIILVLAGITVVAVMGTRERARVAATKGLVTALVSAIQEYYETFKEYPADGVNGPDVSVTGGRQGSAALFYLLCRELKVTRTVGPSGASYQETTNVGPFFKYKRKFLTRKVKDPNTDKVEFKDGWNRAIEYDRVFWPEDGSGVQELNGWHNKSFHTGVAKTLSHPTKNPLEVLGVTREIRKDFYLWSNGNPKYFDEWRRGTKKEPIGNWNLEK